MSIAAIATFMSIEHNYRILIISTTNKEDNLKNCFWEEKKKKKKFEEYLDQMQILKYENSIEGNKNN